jgi:hypothetical protein
MSASSHPVTLPEDLLQNAAQHADRLGVSTQQWIELALAERIRREEETEAFFAVRAAHATGRSLGEILDEGGNNPPDPGDELED